MSLALLDVAVNRSFDGNGFYGRPMFLAGSTCTAVCLGSTLTEGDGVLQETAGLTSLQSVFTCSDDGVWKGELMCPDSMGANREAEDTRLASQFASTSPRSTWRADDYSDLQPRWQLSATKLMKPPRAPFVKCEWIDTHAIRGTYVWVLFETANGSIALDDFNTSISAAPTVNVYKTVYTDNTGSNVKHAEM
jgi:hypothetical protein